MKPNIAAQCVAYIGRHEVAVGTWPDLFERVTDCVIAPGAPERLKEAALEAIGYLCEELVSHASRMYHVKQDVSITST